MERLTLPATQLTPHVDFDFERRALTLQGESYPENAAEFYRPILARLRDYLHGPGGSAKTSVELQFTYVNSSSTRSLQQLLTLLEVGARAGAEIEVRWLVALDDESMTELGLDLLGDKLALSYLIVGV
ncbi:DUF1987 domain-containing protein [Steroidobacter sp.]|uniref:DUF1987 domain-containing protein n=1 Tax=Steroidobacter sp. TaxID=1978227 RepID=UPI001A62078D|nr:DUF1987 domain-containing protein [Steroidobacter sp.]MBL8267488.1 DUF1987 domain-containing protein [Steroidobacter sp.]